MIELQTSVKQDDTTRTRTPKPGYLNLSNGQWVLDAFLLHIYYICNCTCMYLSPD